MKRNKRKLEGTKMPRKYRNALAWAVGWARDWRGSLVGNPDPKPLAAFDTMVNRARAALKMIRK